MLFSLITCHILHCCTLVWMYVHFNIFLLSISFKYQCIFWKYSIQVKLFIYCPFYLLCSSPQSLVIVFPFFRAFASVNQQPKKNEILNFSASYNLNHLSQFRLFFSNFVFSSKAVILKRRPFAESEITSKINDTVVSWIHLSNA